jgi:fermentation-respiration switch protein FrsA (DUF1100 family)
MLKFLETRLVYHPTPADEEWHLPPNGRVRDVALRTPDGTGIHAWWCPHEASSGALLYCHGNGGNLSQRKDLIVDLQDRLKESVLIFDYPGFGKSEGKPTEQGCYAAGDAAYDWLAQEMHISPSRILLYGGSLGGGVAVELASRRDHRALILVNSFTSAPDVGQIMYPWLPIRWLMHNRFDNLGKIGRCRRPVFIASGTADQTIPFVMGERLFAAANEPKRFFPMEGLGHFDPLPAAALDALCSFLKS